MSSGVRLPAALIALGVAALLGFWVGRSTRLPGSSRASASEEGRSTPETTAGPRRPASAAASSASTSMVSPGEALIAWAKSPRAGTEMERVSGLVAQVGRAEIREVFERLPEIPVRTIRGIVESSLLSRWGELGGIEAMDYLTTRSGKSFDYHAKVLQVLAGWVREDPEAALRWAQDLEPGTLLQRQALATAIGGLAVVAPARALAIARESPELLGRELMRTVILTWVMQDPTAAAGALADLDVRWAGIMEGFFAQIAGQWAQRDPDAAFAWVSGLAPPGRQAQARQGWIDGLAEVDPMRALQWARQSDSKELRQFGVGRALTALAQKDLPTAVDLFKHSLSPEEQAQSISGFAWIWGLQDSEGMRAFALSLPAGRVRLEALRAVANQWSQEDPEAALRWARQLPKGAEQAAVLQTVISAFGSSDPEMVLKRAASIPAGAARQQLIATAVQNLASTDPQLALEYLKELPAGPRRTLAGTVLNQLGRMDPQAALAALDTLPASARAEGTRQLLAGWAERDVAGAFAWVKSLPDEETRRTAFGGLGWRLAESMPEEAMQYANTLPAGGARRGALREVAGYWANQDPVAAIGWLGKLAPDADVDDAVGVVLGRWSQMSPHDAAGYVARMPAGAAQNQAAIQLAGAWGNQSPEDALDWAGRFTDPATRSEAQSRVVSAWASNDPEGAAAYARSQPADVARDALVASTVHALSVDDPKSAADLVGLLSAESELRSAVYSQIGTRWAQEDPAGAAAWLKGLPVGPSRDGAVGSTAMLILESAPAAAAALALTLSNETQRRGVTEQVMGQWMKADPAAATAWIRQQPMADAEREALLGMAPR